jgi:quercetin dioxygenase-like cupin family protein
MSTVRDDSQPVPAAIPYVLEDGEGEVIRWFGATVTVKASGPLFDAALTTEVAGSEPPLHAHAAADEALFVVAGSLTVYAGDEVIAAPEGSFVFLPRGVPHTFAVESGSARLLVFGAPAGAVAMLSEAERLFGDRGMPALPRADDLARVAAVSRRHGVTIVSPHPRGRWSGTDSSFRPATASDADERSASAR